MPVDKFNEFKDKHNLSISANAGQAGISAGISGDMDNYKLGIEQMKKLIYNPNITEDNIKTAVIRIKDRMLRTQTTADLLQKDIDSYINHNNICYA